MDRDQTRLRSLIEMYGTDVGIRIDGGFHVIRPRIVDDEEVGGLVILKPVERPLSRALAHTFSEDIRTYHALLTERGILVPPFLETVVHPHPTSSGWAVTEVSSFCGENPEGHSP